MLRHEAISLWKWLTTTLWYMWNRSMIRKDCMKCGANVVEIKSSSKVLICEICEYIQWQNIRLKYVLNVEIL